MARHDWVTVALDNWARWLDQGARGAQGYPKASPFTRLTPSATTTDSDHVPVDDLAAQRVAEVIGPWRYSKPHLWLVLHLRFWGDPRQDVRQQGGPLSISETARTMCVAASTVYAYLNQADELLAVALRR